MEYFRATFLLLSSSIFIIAMIDDRSLYILEVSGVMVAPAGLGVGSGNIFASSASASTTPVVFQPGAFLVSLTAISNVPCGCTLSAASPWVSVSQPISLAAYATSGVSAPTTFPVGIVAAPLVPTVGAWNEVSLAFNPIPSVSGVPEFPLGMLLLFVLLVPALLVLRKKPLAQGTSSR